MADALLYSILDLSRPVPSVLYMVLHLILANSMHQGDPAPPSTMSCQSYPPPVLAAP